MRQTLPATPPAKRGFLSALAALIMVQRPIGIQVLLSAAFFAMAFYGRFAADEILPPGFPFLTFFPAVLLTAVFASVPAGLIVAIASGMAAWYYFIPPFGTFAISGDSAVAMLFYAFVVGAELVLISATAVTVRQLQASEKRASELAHARELMFNELQHRVSNNLATIAALLRMQAGRTQDAAARQVLSEAQLRVSTIARLQRRLHSPDIQWVDLPEFLRDMAADTLEAASADQAATVAFDLAPLKLPHEKAVPFGLIASELMMNAVEHGAAAGQAPALALRLRTYGDDGTIQAVFEVADNGPGVTPGFALEGSTSLGLGIARQFAAMIDGALTIENGPDGGAVSRVTFTV